MQFKAGILRVHAAQICLDFAERLAQNERARLGVGIDRNQRHADQLDLDLAARGEAQARSPFRNDVRHVGHVTVRLAKHRAGNQSHTRGEVEIVDDLVAVAQAVGQQQRRQRGLVKEAKRDRGDDQVEIALLQGLLPGEALRLLRRQWQPVRSHPEALLGVFARSSTELLRRHLGEKLVRERLLPLDRLALKKIEQRPVAGRPDVARQGALFHPRHELPFQRRDGALETLLPYAFLVRQPHREEQPDEQQDDSEHADEPRRHRSQVHEGRAPRKEEDGGQYEETDETPRKELGEAFVETDARVVGRQERGAKLQFHEATGAQRRILAVERRVVHDVGPRIAVVERQVKTKPIERPAVRERQEVVDRDARLERVGLRLRIGTRSDELHTLQPQSSRPRARSAAIPRSSERLAGER